MIKPIKLLILFSLLSLLFASTIFAQPELPAEVVYRDSLVEEPMSGLLKKAIQEAKAQFPNYLRNMEFDLDSVVSTYKIIESSELPPLKRVWANQSAINIVPSNKNREQSAILYINEGFMKPTTYRLVIKGREHFPMTSFIIIIDIFNDNNWLATSEHMLASCGRMYTKKLMVYDGQKWSKIELPPDFLLEDRFNN